MLDDRKQRAWNGLGIGPAWRLRQFEAASASPEEPPTDTAAMLDWEGIASRVESCRDCPLGSARQNAVVGAGPSSAAWMLVGEAPGAEEDKTGEPFVGRAGELLDAMMKAAGVDRQRDVYITNVLKCRPPGNRNPEPSEVAQCDKHLQSQARLLGPRLILLLGRFAAQSVLNTEASIASLRGRVHEARVGGLSIPAIVTYHPAYLLRNPADKARAWADWCLARRTISSQ